MRSYHLLKELRDASSWFRRNEDILQSAVNLMVFIFVVTAIVFVVEDDRNENINNYLDALYFTVTTLTTTGFGDITMTDSVGRLMTVLIMIFGVALFLRLVQTIFPSRKGELCLPRLRPQPPRSGCGSLQTLRPHHQHPDRGYLGIGGMAGGWSFSRRLVIAGDWTLAQPAPFSSSGAGHADRGTIAI